MSFAMDPDEALDTIAELRSVIDRLNGGIEEWTTNSDTDIALSAARCRLRLRQIAYDANVVRDMLVAMKVAVAAGPRT